MKQKRFLRAQWLMFLFILLSFNIISAQENNKPRKSILVFCAHADDVESIAGGTFAKYIAMGYEGIYVDAIIILRDVVWREHLILKGHLFLQFPTPPINTLLMHLKQVKYGKRKLYKLLLSLEQHPYF